MHTTASITPFSTNLVSFSGGAPQTLPVDTVPSFQIETPYVGSGFSYRIFDNEGNQVALIPNSAVDRRHDNGFSTMVHSYPGGTIPLDPNKRYHIVYQVGSIQVAKSQEFDHCDDITHVLEWKNDCDLSDTVYTNSGYVNKLYLRQYDDFPTVVNDDNIITLNNGQDIVVSSTKKLQQTWSIPYVSEDMLIPLSLIGDHIPNGTVELKEVPGTAVREVVEIEVSSEGQDNEFLKVDLLLTFKVINTNTCCDDRELFELGTI